MCCAGTPAIADSHLCACVSDVVAATTVSVHNDGDQPARLLYSTSTLAGCFAKVPAKAIGAHDAVKVPVTLPAHLAADTHGELRLFTNVGAQGVLTVPVRDQAAHEAKSDAGKASSPGM